LDKFKILSSSPKFLLGQFSPKDTSKTYLAISSKQGEFIYDLLVNIKAVNIVEFGRSFGMSIIYLAAAAHITEEHVVTGELLPEKCIHPESDRLLETISRPPVSQT
jgi:predicted O-methyltransferase YrrM